MQTQIDFTHKKENNAHSEAILDKNYERLNKQCQLVLTLLKSGLELTVREAMISYGIGDLRRRICDLRQAGIDVKDTVLRGGCKQFYLEKNNL